MKLFVWICVLLIPILTAAATTADTHRAKALANCVSALSPDYNPHGGAIAGLVVAHDVPEPKSLLLLSAGLMSLALLIIIGRPPFRLKF